MGNSYGKASMPNKDFDNAGDVLGGISDALNNENAWDSGVDTMQYEDPRPDRGIGTPPPIGCVGCGSGTGTLIDEEDITL